ncbi:hypothetical protein IW261DRAFT_1509424 [Armillaria novae-zelandiae]|uniref:Uncharacterized protein n=1 Tax=Armillaria novae-zelandiae TaxID=153914 RepID=A0AA39NUM5_9AGAR|nr:hypothetical protein IW261DRAFT_1509424 [Armillaria novae-zelandiae]
MMRPHLGPLGLFCCLLFGILAQAKLVNVTVDDNSPSIFYSPEDGWQDSLVPCQGCTARPNSSRAIYGTWHDSTHYADVGSEVNTIPNASISFNGTAIYVMCILAQTTTSPTGNSDMSFYIDGNLVGQFIKAAPGESGFEYNVSVYSNSSIPPGQHSFTVQNGQIGGIKSLALLDAFVYSYDDGRSSDDDKSGSHTTTVTNSPHISAIIGFSVAGSLALVLGILYHLSITPSPDQRRSRRTGAELLLQRLIGQTVQNGEMHHRRIISNKS